MSPRLSDTVNAPVTVDPLPTLLPHIHTYNSTTNGMIVANDLESLPRPSILVRRRKRWGRRAAH